ncbi:MAG: YneF family protein [Acholeplasmatales bacterium]|nr:YneF family protein [Acholeplasmatales bacterium]
MTGLPVVGFVFIVIGCLVLGFIIGFIVTRKVISKYLKKNPPVNEQMIRAMYRQMGRTPSEKQIREVMRSMEDAKTKK